MSAPQSDRSGGEVLVASLLAQGTSHAFGVPGESYLAVLDALHDVVDRLRFVVCRHEGGAAYMAEAYGKLTGRPGVALVTRGPGASNAAIGIHTAAQDSTPVLLLVSGGQLGDLELREDLFDDFCLSPFHPKELEARLRHLLWRSGRGSHPEVVEYGDLALNVETYQAALGERPLDLTYMEYELLKFFATHPGKVFSREQLLSRVWGYEYYGGARTVDVHVRRLRAKLGEEHAGWIQTVRSVGYRFGQPRGLAPV